MESSSHVEQTLSHTQNTMRGPSRSAHAGSPGSPSENRPNLPPFVRSLAQSTPALLTGEERIRHHVEQLAGLELTQRAGMRSYIDTLLSRMATLNASDIDIGGMAERGSVWFRVDGRKRPDTQGDPLSPDESALLILNLLTRSGIERLLSWRAADFSYELNTSHNRARKRFRASAYLDLGNLVLNMRAISNEIRSLRSLGFHPVIEKGLLFSHVRDGLTLITGVTGSGKSSTLDAIVDANNGDAEGHIVVIGKPIEYVHESKKCIVRHREVGVDVPSFKDGIVQALRQDPDIVVIGEMRDPETITSAMEITDSGHKVFSTLHTSSAVESIDRIIAEYPGDQQDRIRQRLADVLRCVVSQKLLPKRGGGRILAKEVLWMSPQARAAVKNGNTGEIYQMMWEGWSQGQITLEQDLFRLMKQGHITPDTALAYANNKRRLAKLA